MARWRNRPDAGVIPAWVLDAWRDQGDPDGLIDVWLDDLWERDREAWGVAFLTLISIPTYTRPR